jgi:3-phenylpropionate/cinnamic acid dioxygenase small subunit
MTADGAALRVLVDRAAVTDVLVRYARALDARDLEAVATCFTSDAAYDGSLATGSIAVALAALAETIGRYERTLHLLGTPAIEIDGDRARADTPCVAFQRLVDAAGPHDLTIAVRYVDELRRDVDGWRICSRRVRIEWRRSEPVAVPDA